MESGNEASICAYMWQFRVEIEILFRRVRVCRSCHCVQSAISLNVKGGTQTRWVRRYVNIYYIYTARLNPALNGSSEIRRFERSDAIEIRDGITVTLISALDMYTSGNYVRTCI